MAMAILESEELASSYQPPTSLPERTNNEANFKSTSANILVFFFFFLRFTLLFRTVLGLGVHQNPVCHDLDTINTIEECIPAIGMVAIWRLTRSTEGRGGESMI
jgi:hypothetical protein